MSFARVLAVIAALTCLASPVAAQSVSPIIATRDLARVAGLAFTVPAAPRLKFGLVPGASVGAAPRLKLGLVPSASVGAAPYRSSWKRRLLVGALVGFAAGAVVGAVKACGVPADRESYCGPAVGGLGAAGAVLGVLVAYSSAP